MSRKDVADFKILFRFWEKALTNVGRHAPLCWI